MASSILATAAHLDDIIVLGRSENELDERLDKLLERIN